MAVCRRGRPRIVSRRFKVARTSWGDVPVLYTPRNVPTASPAYSAAGSPLPETSPRYRPTRPSVRQFEVIQEIAAHGGEGLELVRDHHRAGAQRFRGQHHALDRASFFEFFFSQFFEGT